MYYLKKIMYLDTVLTQNGILGCLFQSESKRLRKLRKCETDLKKVFVCEPGINLLTFASEFVFLHCAVPLSQIWWSESNTILYILWSVSLHDIKLIWLEEFKVTSSTLLLKSLKHFTLEMWHFLNWHTCDWWASCLARNLGYSFTIKLLWAS